MTNKSTPYGRFLRTYFSYRRGDERCPVPPLRLWLETSALCNLRCVMCPNKEMAPETKGHIDEDLFKKVIDEAKDYIFDLNLHHRGESLLHPHFTSLLAYAAGKGMKTRLHTNGTLLTPEIMMAMVDAPLDRLSLSFDGFNAQDYEKIRVGAEYEDVVERIIRLLEWRKKQNSRKPAVAIEVIAMSQSQVEKKKKRIFLEKMKRAGLDELVIKKPHNWAGYLTTHHKEKGYSPCTFLWNALLVLWNGDVVPCAQDFFAQQVIGNVSRKSLLEIWNDEPIREMRRNHREKRYDLHPACKGCDRLWRPSFMGIPKEYLSRFLFRRMP